MTRTDDRESARSISDSLIHHVGGIAESCGAAAIFVYLDALPESERRVAISGKTPVFHITRDQTDAGTGEHAPQRLHVPDVPLSRTSQVKIAVFLALARGLVKRGDIIVCLSGPPASGQLDALFVTQVGREFDLYSAADQSDELPVDVSPQVLERVIDIAVTLGAEGREGKPVGALFVVGDSERVATMSRQLILNPFRGYPEAERNVLDPALEETVKELSTIDGAFLIRGDGVVESAGAYLKTSGSDEYSLPQGLGARHHAAAGITAVCDAVAITVSESTGTVTIFRNGHIITELNKPRQLDAKTID